MAGGLALLVCALLSVCMVGETPLRLQSDSAAVSELAPNERARSGVTLAPETSTAFVEKIAAPDAGAPADKLVDLPAPVHVAHE